MTDPLRGVGPHGSRPLVVVTVDPRVDFRQNDYSGKWRTFPSPMRSISKGTTQPVLLRDERGACVSRPCHAALAEEFAPGGVPVPATTRIRATRSELPWEHTDIRRDVLYRHPQRLPPRTSSGHTTDSRSRHHHVSRNYRPGFASTPGQDRITVTPNPAPPLGNRITELSTCTNAHSLILSYHSPHPDTLSVAVHLRVDPRSGRGLNYE
jgi:hypothetical protein